MVMLKEKLAPYSEPRELTFKVTILLLERIMKVTMTKKVILRLLGNTFQQVINTLFSLNK